MFIFAGAAAIDVHDISPSLLAWALSVNAITGVLATRQTARRGHAGWWLGGTALAAHLVGTVSSPFVLFLALALWGFSFWMAVPAVFKLLAEKSLVPSERIGDAQAAMATGRIAGPILGGLALGAGSYGRLSIVGTSVMVVGAVTVSIIETYRSREARNS